MTERRLEYDVCRKRGHSPSGIVLSSYPPWEVCKFCGTNYRFETTMIEGYNVPPANDSGVLAALTTSPDVLAALESADIKCLILGPDAVKCGGATKGVNVRLHLPCVLAALANESGGKHAE